MLKRIFLGTLAVIAFLVLAVTLTWYLAFFAGPRPPKSLQSPHVSASVSVAWSEDGPLHIDGQNLDDVLLGLGYGMGRARSWQLVLWRQAALGRLSEWFGDDLIPTDRLMRQLGIGSAAQKDLSEFPEEAQRAISQLSNGLNAALLDADVARGTPFLLLGIEPEPWEAWHTTAVERLFVWLGSEPFEAPEPSVLDASPSSSFAGSSLGALQADKTLRSLLQIDGFGFNTLTASYSDSSAFISARFVTGNVSIPFFVEVEINTPSLAMSGLMVPGTLVSPLGVTQHESSAFPTGISRRAWSFLLSGNASISEEMVPMSQLTYEFERIETESKEDLVFVSRMQSRMPLVAGPRDVNAGPVKMLSWSGFTELSDFPIWLRLIQGQQAVPSLMNPDGIQIENGQLAVMGQAPYVIQKETGEVFLASKSSAFTPAERFNTMGSPLDPITLLNDVLNQHASQSLATLLSFLPDSLLLSDRLQQGVRYLRNWNDQYAEPEIGASIYDHIVQKGLAADSTAPATLRSLLDEMAGLYGPDMSTWRWENVHKRELLFPGTSVVSEDVSRPVSSFNKKFNPIEVGGPGHPQTFVWGSSGPLNGSHLASAWEGAINFSTHDLLYRRPYINYSAFLGPFLSADRPISINSLSENIPVHSTTIVPTVTQD